MTEKSRNKLMFSSSTLSICIIICRIDDAAKAASSTRLLLGCLLKLLRLANITCILVFWDFSWITAPYRVPIRVFQKCSSKIYLRTHAEQFVCEGGYFKMLLSVSLTIKYGLIQQENLFSAKGSRFNLPIMVSTLITVRSLILMTSVALIHSLAFTS